MTLWQKTIRIAVSVSCCLALTAAQAAPINCGDHPIRLAFYDFGLFHFQDKNKTARGIDKDIVDELIKRSGCSFETQVLARARIWSDLAGGALDMSVSGIQTPERDHFAWFAPYLTMKNYAIVSAQVAREVSRGSEFVALPKLRFGVVRAFKHGTEQDHWIEQLRQQHRIEESADVDALFRKLKGHRIDAMFSQPPVYQFKLQELDMSSEVVVQDWTPDEKGVPHGLILAKSRFSAAEAAQWQALVAEMRSDGTLKRIYHRYLPTNEAARMLNFQG